VSLLKRYNESPDDFNRPTPPPPEIIEENEEPEYEVEEILDTKTVRRKRFYLVKWVGYPLYDATWEPIENLTNAGELITEYNQRGR
jgi:chromodomain-containing protein